MMRIFELRWTSQGEKEWVSGKTVIEALKTYLSETDMDMSDFDVDDEIVELPKKEWSKMHVISQYGMNITFEEWMKRNPTPEIITGTMYQF